MGFEKAIREPIARLARRWDVDTAVALGILMRCWQIPASGVTLILIYFFFTPDTQGIYYTVLGVLGLQQMAEAGLQSVILHAASHEWSSLSLDGAGRLQGDEKAVGRLAALAQGTTRWFAICALLFAAVATGWGYWLFHTKTDIAILLPMYIAIGVSALSLVVGGLIAILEGCNQVERVNSNRLFQAVTGSLVVWGFIAGGLRIWTVAASFAIQLCWELFLIFRRYGPLVRQLYQTTPSEPFDWWGEVWPLQWKIGLQGFVRQLAFVPMLPVLYRYQGSVVAGQAGMSISVLNNLTLAAYAWIRTRAPRLGEMIATGDTAAKNQLFKRTTVNSTVALIAANSAIVAVIYALSVSDYSLVQKISERFLPLYAIAWFALAAVPQHLVQCFSIYIRAHRQDPLWMITITANTVLALLVVLSAKYLGAYAIGGSLFLVYGGITLPAVFMVWRRFRDSN